MNSPSRNPTLRLFDYYIIEGLNSFACTLFLLSVFFWARARYDFSNTENLLLGAVQGVCYIASSRLCGILADRIGYNRLLVAALTGTSIIMLVAWIPDWRPMPYITLGVYAVFMGGTWPALEAGAMHLPGKLNVPQRLGIYNLVWSITGAAGFFLSGFIFIRDPNSVLWLTGCIHVTQIAWIFYHRGRHTITGNTAMHFPHHGDREPREVKVRMTRLSWLSNSLGYYLACGFAALTPHLGVKLGLSQSWTIWLGCSLLAARSVGFVIFYRWQGWHYHRGWALYALWSAPLYLSVVFFADRLWMVAPACLLLGVSLGLSYYMSIYYSLDASENKGEQGGLHEAIIGIGILTGPLVGAAGGYVTGTTLGAKAAIIGGAIVVASLGLLYLRNQRTDTPRT